MPTNVRLGNGVLSKDVKLSYKTDASANWVQVRNLQEFPDLGGAAERVDVTTWKMATINISMALKILANQHSLSYMTIVKLLLTIV